MLADGGPLNKERHAMTCDGCIDCGTIWDLVGYRCYTCEVEHSRQDQAEQETETTTDPCRGE